MPLYEYECANKKCKLFGKLQAIVCYIHERNGQRCPECDIILGRLVSRTSFRIK